MVVELVFIVAIASSVLLGYRIIERPLGTTKASIEHVKRVWQTLDVRCGDDFVLLGCEPKILKTLFQVLHPKTKGSLTHTHTLSLFFFFFFFFFLYVYNVKSTIWKTLFFLPFLLCLCANNGLMKNKF
jgi:hypothetical protein